MSQPLTPRRQAAWLAALTLLVASVSLWALGVGSTAMGMGDALGALLGQGEPIAQAIVWQARLPRVALACAVGAGLGVSGAAFQALLRNPLADPYILGISGGAALGGTLWMTLGGALWRWGAPAGSLAGAALSVLGLALLQRASGQRGLDPLVLLLSGVIFNAFASALITLIKAVVPAQQAQSLLHYLMGTLAVEGLPWAVIAAVAAVVVVSELALCASAAALDLMTLGDEDARSLGVDPPRVRRWVMAWASLAVAACVAFTGLIGFVGLVVPHGLRLLVGSDHRLLMPASALLGAAFLIGCDGLARSLFEVFSTTLPVGVITACLGAPIFVVLLVRSLRRGELGGG